MRTLLTSILLVSVPGFAPAAQENVRQLEGSAVETKFLTPNGNDLWKIQLDQGETLVVHVTTRDFDPVLELVAPDDAELLEIDDEGSESRFARRVEAGGEYRVVVRGFENRGGGNYQIAVEVLRATPVEIGAEAVVEFDDDGRAHCRLDVSEDDIVVPVVSGRYAGLVCRDPAGAPIGDWSGTYRAERSGEHLLSLTGPARGRVRVTAARARRSVLAEDSPVSDVLRPGEMHVYEMSRASMDFRLATLTARDGIQSRIVRASRPGARVLRDRGFDLRFLPILSKGLHQRFAAIFGRDDRYELQVLSTSVNAREYGLAVRDPRQPIDVGVPAEGALAVGDSSFYRFDAEAGQLLAVDLQSAAFDPLLRLYDGRGQELQIDDDGGEDLDSRLEHLAREAGTYMLQVSSRGDGGGGAFTLALVRRDVERLVPGEVRRAVLGEGGGSYWHFEGTAGRTLVLSVRSKSCDPTVEVLGPDGVVLGRDADGGVDRDCLLPLRLDRTGRHTVRVDVRGEGECELRLIALD